MRPSYDGAKGVIKDVGRVLDMSYSEADRLSRMIPTRPGHNTTLEEALSEEPQFRAEVRNNPQARKLIEVRLEIGRHHPKLGHSRRRRADCTGQTD